MTSSNGYENHERLHEENEHLRGMVKRLQAVTGEEGNESVVLTWKQYRELQAVVDAARDLLGRHEVPINLQPLEDALRALDGEPFSLERLLEDSGFHRNLDGEP